ncbi:MAG TPA: hypothetical protein VMY43_05795, partial [Methanothrix sp.]|nr:hypothetical protein [Methanothrix sp.]
MLMVTGVLLAISASAQFNQQPGAFGREDFSAQDNLGGDGFNQQPRLIALESDKLSPQEAGSPIKWTAKAEDPENDAMSFMFRLKGPSTGEVWMQVTQWSQDNTWKWDTNSADAGKNQISVWVRDESHAGPQFTPDEKTVDFLLTLPQALPVVEVQPTVEPLPIVQAPEPTYVPPVEVQQPVQPVQAAEPMVVEPVNRAPVMTSLTSIPASPQEAGTAIAWSAEASDQESDGLQFQFLLDDQPITEWQYKNQWTWYTSANEFGAHSIEARVRDGAHNSEGDSSKKASFTLNKPNETPFISDLSADKASPQEMGSIVTWKALANDPENDPVLFRFFLNGLPTTDWQSSNQWAWTAAEGESQVEVQIRDGKHAEQDGFDDRRSATFIVLPPNQKPAIINFSPDKLSPQEIGSTITWNVVVMDVDNDPIQYQFSMDGQVVQDWSGSPVWSWTAAADQVGQHAIEVKVRDAKHNDQGDNSGSANFEIVLPPNNAPVMSSLTADSESPQVTGTTVTWTAVASDAENDPLQFLFSMDGRVMQDWSDSSVWSWTAAADLVGLHTIEVKVRDAKHNDQGDSSSIANFEIVLPPNNAPVLSSLTADSESPQVTGTTVTWTAVASDTENEQLQYLFSMDEKVVQDWSDSPTWSWTATADQVGQHAIEARVRDGKHNPEGDNSGSANFEIVLPPNNAPEMSSLTADSESPQVTGTVVTWTAVASDTENDPLQYLFSMDGQIVQDWSDSPVWSWTSAADQVGQHAIEAKVRDGKHNAEGDNSSSANFEIVLPPNNAPVVSSLTADSDSPQVTGTAVTWTAVASDTENDPLQYLFSMDGQIVQDWSDSPVWSWTAAADQVGQHAIEAKVRDGKHNAEGDNSGSANFEIVLPPNNAPEMSSLTADSESPQVTGTTVTWTAVASDAENEPLQYLFSMDEKVVQDWSDSPVWSWTATADQVGPHTIEARVKDGKHNPEGDSASSANFEIVLPPNDAPALSSLTADSDSPQTLGTLGAAVTWTAKASDPESDPITYRFLVNSTPATEWQSENMWTWTAMQPGTSLISVQVRDSLHEENLGEGGNMSREFSIIAPVAEIKPEQEPVASENVTVPEENKTELVTPVPEVVAPPVTENITIPIVPENVTQPERPVNETQPVAIAPETVIPPAAEENITTPLVPENVTIPLQPVNETDETKTAPAAVNQTPVLNSLTADVASPQIPGTTIIWTAKATDADSDPLLFRFFLSGPTTNSAWQPVTEWSDAGAWTQKTSSADAGENQVKVQVRDGKHAAEDGFDGEIVAFFTISEPAMNISGAAYEDKNGN